jgi:hypothetical protein
MSSYTCSDVQVSSMCDLLLSEHGKQLAAQRLTTIMKKRLHCITFCLEHLTCLGNFGRPSSLIGSTSYKIGTLSPYLVGFWGLGSWPNISMTAAVEGQRTSEQFLRVGGWAVAFFGYWPTDTLGGGLTRLGRCSPARRNLGGGLAGASAAAWQELQRRLVARSAGE